MSRGVKLKELPLDVQYRAVSLRKVGTVTVRGPVTLSLPWSVLLGDNHRMMPVVVYVKGKPKARLIMSGEYRAAKLATTRSIQDQWDGAWPIEGAVQLVARAWFPDERKRDCGNYRKLITDALTKIAYNDDSQLHDERWIRAGVDRTSPRIDVTLQPITLLHPTP